MLDAATVGIPGYLLERDPFPEYLKMGWFDAFPRIVNRDQLRDAVVAPVLPQDERRDLLRTQIDAGIDEVRETARLLARFAASAPPQPCWSAVAAARAVGQAPRRTLGSVMRWIGMHLPFGVRLARSGVRQDFFTGRDVARLLRQHAETAVPPAVAVLT